MTQLALTSAQLSRRIRRHVEFELYDESGVSPLGTAIYVLSNPRDIRYVRYVGQTSNPRRRFLQHLNAARLSLRDERPWWIKTPTLRPLYDWIRALYREERRMPTMVVSDWADTTIAARLIERTRIFDGLRTWFPLLNFEGEIMGRQIRLL